MNFYNEIKTKLLENEIYSKVKDYSKERYKVITYFEIGKLLSDAGKKYGKNIIKQYSEKLIMEVGKKYNERTLRRIRQFYEIFKNEKWSTMWTKLSWSHYREVLVFKDINEIKYYLNECENKSLTQRQLHELIKQNTYNRLSQKTKNKLIESEHINIEDFIPNPLLFKKKEINTKITEYALKQIILNELDAFLGQLGYGFSYIGNEYSIKLGDRYNYIDLLLFNIEYNCYVVVELKATELKKEHIGQIQVYMNYIDKNIRKINQDKTIGIIICKENNKYIIKYSSDERIISRTYELV